MQIKFNFVVLDVCVSKRLTYVNFQCKKHLHDIQTGPDALCIVDSCIILTNTYWPMCCVLCIRWIKTHTHSSNLYAVLHLYVQKHANNVDTFQLYHVRHWACLMWLMLFSLFKWTNNSSIYPSISLFCFI